MKAVPECVACSLKQISGSRKHIPGFTEELEERAVRESMNELLQKEWGSLTPAALTEMCILAIGRAMGAEDPFREAKQKFNRVAMEHMPHIRRIVESREDKLQTAFLVAAAGNIIDLGLIARVDVPGTLERVLQTGFKRDDMDRFRAYLDGFNRRGRKPSLLYIADNAGEIVFDALAIELLAGYAEVAAVVRGGPILNDALEEDARFAGIQTFARVMTTGCSRLGILEGCSDEFWQALRQSDLVIAKGHANYETIEEQRPGMFFLLTAKCGPVAQRLGVAVGDTVFVEGNQAG